MAHFHIPKRSKYKAVRTTVDNIEFASKREAARYAQLKLMEKAGEIYNLQTQPSYPCIVNGVKVCTYKGDFAYFTKGTAAVPSKAVTEDVKGVRTPIYRLKKKLVEAIYMGVVIKEV